jgi:hypothetical protein
MKKTIVCTAAISAALTLVAVWGLGGAALPTKVKLENARVRVTEVIAAPGAARERRPPDRSGNRVPGRLRRYERTDPASGEKTVRKPPRPIRSQGRRRAAACECWGEGVPDAGD